MLCNIPVEQPEWATKGCVPLSWVLFVYFSLNPEEHLVPRVKEP